MSAITVPCPVCSGDGVTPFSHGNKCLCCKGAGEISLKHDLALASIRKDLNARLMENEIRRIKEMNEKYGPAGGDFACLACNGTGLRDDGEGREIICPDCKGDGIKDES